MDLKGRGEGVKFSTPLSHRPAVKNTPGGTFCRNKVKPYPLEGHGKALEEKGESLNGKAIFYTTPFTGDFS